MNNFPTTQQSPIGYDEISSSGNNRVSDNISIDKMNRQDKFSNSLSYLSLSEEEQIERNAMHMYDSATWRMYHRIMADRKRREEMASRIGLSHTTDVPHNQEQPIQDQDQNLHYPTDPQEDDSSCSSFSSPMAKRRSCSWASSHGPYDCEHEDIFQLEL